MKRYYELVRYCGNEELFQAVEMSVTAVTSGHPFHIHAEGLRGTGKTTIMRAASGILPPITRVKNCIYNCYPDKPHCPEHRHLSREQLEQLGTETVQRPFLEISHAAKIGTVVGSIDLGKLLDRSNPVAALLPGTILKAHRGVVFIDEINRLADTSPELADVLLDVMGSKPGRVQVEETGLPTVEMPVEVNVWAASNPDEEPGALSIVRKQLSDRFDIAVSMGRPGEYQSVMAILSQRDDSKIAQIAGPAMAGDFRKTIVDERIRGILAAVYVDFGLESLRAVEALETAARLSAVHAARQAVAINDIVNVAPMVLSHRADNATLAGILKYLQSRDRPELISVSTADLTGNHREQNELTERKNETESWWTKVLAGLKNKFGFGSRRADSAPQRDVNSQQRQPAQKKGGSSASAGTGQVADPTNAVIVAPPQVARPLAELPSDQFVSGEERKKNV